jgi:hypothetical protein
VLVGATDDDVVGPLLVVRAEQEERSVGFFIDLLQLLRLLEGVDIVPAVEHRGMDAAQ